MNQELVDRFGRRFTYLRLSITDICNFRCQYCLPDGHQGHPGGFLSRDEIRRLIAGFAELGIRKLRITGGEPLVRRDVLEIVREAAATPGIKRLAMTTNAYRLAYIAQALRDAGLDAINVSVDSLDPVNFERITGDRRHSRVMEGVESAVESGIGTVKVNIVLLKGANDHEVPDFIEFVRERPITVRFIELMQTANNTDYFKLHHTRGVEIARQLEETGWQRMDRRLTSGPAVEFRHLGYRGRVGVITPYKPGFCDSCNRLRVTARGGLRLCLFGHGIHDLRPYLQDDDSRPELKRSILDALSFKRVSHFLHQGDYGDTPHLANSGG